MATSFITFTVKYCIMFTVRYCEMTAVFCDLTVVMAVYYCDQQYAPVEELDLTVIVKKKKKKPTKLSSYQLAKVFSASTYAPPTQTLHVQPTNRKGLYGTGVFKRKVVVGERNMNHLSDSTK